MRRCAIYTRKSTEEGLEQNFNSLHAQREACEAFIKSQRHESWRALRGHFDDGGLSGGSMNRPALARLLEGRRATLEPGLFPLSILGVVQALAQPPAGPEVDASISSNGVCGA